MRSKALPALTGVASAGRGGVRPRAVDRPNLAPDGVAVGSVSRAPRSWGILVFRSSRTEFVQEAEGSTRRGIHRPKGGIGGRLGEDRAPARVVARPGPGGDRLGRRALGIPLVRRVEG